MTGLPMTGGRLGETAMRWLGEIDRGLGWLIEAGRWLVLPVALVLFLQWLLRDWVQAWSREANDLGQWIFALYVSLAMTFATRERAHLAVDAIAHGYSPRLRGAIARWGEFLCVAPWPLYVFMGALLYRLPLADRLFRCGVALGGRSHAAPSLATLGLGALLAPMNGSVGASVAMLSRSVAPKLAARGVPAAESTALVCVSSTLGVVIPPSLVLILLGDAMMRAHTEATNVTKAMVRIVNTQDIFRGALVPAALFLLLCLCVAWLLGRRAPARRDKERPRASEWL